MRASTQTSSGRVQAALATLVILLAASASCTPSISRQPVNRNVDIAQLWEAPTDLVRRDLAHGPGGRRLAPDAGVTYKLEKVDRTGYSDGYDVIAPDGRRWSVKIGPESQTEVVSSRVLWALGYHQPVVYYVPQWKMSGAVDGLQPAGRFRLEESHRKTVGDWSWYENDFVHTQPFKGLIVANLILNNWDWKTSNNKIIETRENGSTGRIYLVRDLGASLGRTTFPGWLSWTPLRKWKQGTRNDIEGFESQNLIERVDENRVDFDYRGLNASLVESVGAADVIWTCRLMSRISDRQWNDLFGSAGYPDAESLRYIRKIKAKIAEGLTLARSAAP
jgi:hypothetical protein